LNKQTFSASILILVLPLHATIAWNVLFVMSVHSFSDREGMGGGRLLFFNSPYQNLYFYREHCIPCSVHQEPLRWK